ncbi:ATP-binding cassette domain-containing protein [Azospirillum sp. RWY-5-1]|uniref:ATP-binding cassette domain-containing protein n=1 Tax=Azospirillum oleiclasticum TaxID=2735135 RepID=A0ABX2TFL7_9PROT|nr:ATP-binding cassette domain-containing protein [Azospirillum oleiclasticum]NYZ15846.1 ATP-binding cassette domain-containing protein [Azospirillum oleiclasticum]NYZ22116.1 ATP-binding cassette domain-containing protein [Azospirillum oleiclasticum]
MSPLFTASGVKKSYGGLTVLRGVDLHVEPGEILGLVGANGAGKSTFVDIITGITPANEGEILLGGTRLAGSPSQRAKLGLARTFQHPQLAFEMSLRENIAVGRSTGLLSNWTRTVTAAGQGLLGGCRVNVPAIEKIASELGLKNIDRLAQKVSFGELRLVEVARALMQSPRLLVLDEPFSGVGDSGTSGIIFAIKRVRDSGCAVLLIDHNIDLLVDTVDRMALLSQGRITVEGSVAECMGNAEFRSTYIGVG